MRIIAGPDDIAEGAAWLAARDRKLAEGLKIVGEIPLRRRREGFRELFSVIVSQQVSLASAAAIWRRLEAAGLTGAGAVAAASEAELRAAGLSGPKIRYAKAIAAEAPALATLAGLDDAAAIARLIELPGIGRWSAEIYVMFSLGRADVFAGGDLAVQEAARGLYGLAARPSEAELRAMAEAWSPWRGVAARLLWAYYRITKKREGIWT